METQCIYKNKSSVLIIRFILYWFKYYNIDMLRFKFKNNLFHSIGWHACACIQLQHIRACAPVWGSLWLLALHCHTSHTALYPHKQWWVHDVMKENILFNWIIFQMIIFFVRSLMIHVPSDQQNVPPNKHKLLFVQNQNR